MVTALPATSDFAFSGVYNDEVSGTVDWTAVEGYPTSPELIGTFTVGTLFAGLLLYAAEFAADFPIGSVDSIDVPLSFDPFYCPSVAPGIPDRLSVGGGFISGPIFTVAPEPASLSILGVALGIYLIARRVARRPTEEPSEDPASA